MSRLLSPRQSRPPSQTPQQRAPSLTRKKWTWKRATRRAKVRERMKTMTTPTRPSATRKAVHAADLNYYLEAEPSERQYRAEDMGKGDPRRRGGQETGS
ncbi:hypothetical protein AMAG_20653 [Allomyces macrogynus ATCC 38327]|uniref:Uncharacterized protein n=1 Tax=Allomyces macrogynus (strain ATCC 38327) TaxID=578462 RepID=A0A0L0TEJ5_ALLM3|nr:hypothetical protein AMAG_20653 [Allomyces macrogynus ATCC 38327]|eukprot:KNE72979.1 hypothetical protein AMAG_20653 [Allomyces macrogynus ATCC 38327]